MREQLLGYLMGALDENETREVRQFIESRPELQDELSRLQKHLDTLENSWDDVPAPSGLAAKTCAMLDQPLVSASEQPSSSVNLDQQISAAVASEVDETPKATPARKLSLFESLAGGPSQFTLLDSVVAIGACLAAAAIFFPALAGSRMLATRLQCENNLRQVGTALHQFANGSPQSKYPEIQSKGPLAVAGAFAPQLLVSGFLPYEDALSCAATDTTNDVPTVEEMIAAKEQELAKIHRELDQLYTYNLGVQDSGKVAAPRSQGRAHYPLASDVVTVSADGITTSSHANQGINMLFDDGSVRFINMADTTEGVRHYFINDNGVVEAGLHDEDPVLGSGSTHPFQMNK